MGLHEEVIIVGGVNEFPHLLGLKLFTHGHGVVTTIGLKDTLEMLNRGREFTVAIIDDKVTGGPGRIAGIINETGQGTRIAILSQHSGQFPDIGERHFRKRGGYKPIIEYIRSR